jgi:hypothetical protein
LGEFLADFLGEPPASCFAFRRPSGYPLHHLCAFMASLRLPFRRFGGFATIPLAALFPFGSLQIFSIFLVFLASFIYLTALISQIL